MYLRRSVKVQGKTDAELDKVAQQIAADDMELTVTVAVTLADTYSPRVDRTILLRGPKAVLLSFSGLSKGLADAVTSAVAEAEVEITQAVFDHLLALRADAEAQPVVEGDEA